MANRKNIVTDVAAASAEWVDMAIRDLHRHVMNLMGVNGLTFDQDGVNTLAEMLSVSLEEINNIFMGRPVSLNTFAAIMIGSGNALEIKPINVPSRTNRMPQMPMGDMPMGGRMPQMPMGDMPMGGRMPQMPMGNSRQERQKELPKMSQKMPSRDSRGRFVKSTNTVSTVANQKRRQDLINTILMRGWGDEIDVYNSTLSELEQFFLSKCQPANQ